MKPPVAHDMIIHQLFQLQGIGIENLLYSLIPPGFHGCIVGSEYGERTGAVDGIQHTGCFKRLCKQRDLGFRCHGISQPVVNIRFQYAVNHLYQPVGGRDIGSEQAGTIDGKHRVLSFDPVCGK